MRITVEINPGKDIDGADLTQLLQWAQRCDTGAAVLGEAIGSLERTGDHQLEPVTVVPSVLTLPPFSISESSISGQIMQQISSPVTVPPLQVATVAGDKIVVDATGDIAITLAPTAAPVVPAAVAVAKKRGRRSAAEIEAQARQYAEALEAQQDQVIQSTWASGATATAWAPGVAVPPGMGAEPFSAVPATNIAPTSDPFPPVNVPQVQPQAPAMPVVPPGSPINGVGGELTVDEMRSACSQMNNVKQGMPYRVLKNFGFFTIEAVPADQRANLVAAMQNELSAVA